MQGLDCGLRGLHVFRGRYNLSAIGQPETANLLADAVLKYLHICRPQVFDQLAVGIPDHKVECHFLRRTADSDRRSLSRDLAGERRAEQSEWQQAHGSHGGITHVSILTSLEFPVAQNAKLGAGPNRS